MCDRQTEKKIDGLEFWVQNLQFQRLSFGESFNAKPWPRINELPGKAREFHLSAITTPVPAKSRTK